MSTKLGSDGSRGYFSAEETDRRYTLLKKRMDELDLDGVLLIGSSATSAQEEFYFLQADSIPGSPSATFVPRQGNVVALSRRLQALHYRTYGTAAEIVALVDGDDFGSEIVGVLRENGVTRGRVGWRWSSVPAAWYQRLTAELPDVEWVDMAAAFKDIWYTKSPEEGRASIRSGEIADAGFEHLLKVVEPGMTEYDVVAEFERVTVHNGANRNFTLIASGKFENGRGFPELAPASWRVLEPGDSVMLEMTPAFSGFYTQLVRTFQVGGVPDPKVNELRQVAVDALAAAASILRAGATIGEVAEGLLASVRKAGFEPVLPIGHTVGVGLVYDRLLPELDRVLHENDTLIIHPRVHHPDGEYGFFWGETYLVTADGSAKLHKASTELEIAG